MKVGRPQTYTDEVLAGLAAKLLDWINQEENFWLGSFAVEHGFPRERYSDFCERSVDFHYAYKIAKTVQEAKLVERGLNSRTSATMAIFALKNVAGWRDLQEVEHRFKPLTEDYVGDITNRYFPKEEASVRTVN